MPDEALGRILGEIQRRGAIGRGPLDAAIAHARQFVELLPQVATDVAPILVDLGSGGGLPGLVIAAEAPDWQVHLVERRAKRADLLDYGVRALGLAARVTVHGCDVAQLPILLLSAAEVVSARSFAPPKVVLSTAAPLLRVGGLVLISEPPDLSARCSDAELHALGFVDLGRTGGVRSFRRSH